MWFTLRVLWLCLVEFYTRKIVRESYGECRKLRTTVFVPFVPTVLAHSGRRIGIEARTGGRENTQRGRAKIPLATFWMEQMEQKNYIYILFIIITYYLLSFLKTSQQ